MTGERRYARVGCLQAVGVDGVLKPLWEIEVRTLNMVFRLSIGTAEI